MNAPDPLEISILTSAAFALKCAAWLDGDTLLLLLDTPADETSPLPAAFGTAAEAGELDAVEFADSRLQSAGAMFSRALLLSVRAPEEWPPDAALRIGRGEQALTLDAAAITARTTPLKTLAREHLAGLEPELRHAFQQFLGQALRDASSGSRVLHQNLQALREALRERMPLGVVAPDQSQVLSIDTLLGIDETSFYIEGWMRDIDSHPARLTVVSPEGERTEILPHLARYPRPDLHAFDDSRLHSDQEERHGFLAYFQPQAPSRLTSGWIVELENAHGDAIEAAAPSLIRNLAIIRERLLHDVRRDDTFDRSLLQEHILPALQRVQQLHASRIAVERVLDFGPQPPAPDVSIIVPIYKRIDLIEQQFAQFVHDPELRDAELIYVLDSPEDREWFLSMTARLHEHYRINFRAVLMKQNGGFSAANNTGAEHARGRLLLLLNSDVLPAAPGWLRRLAAFHDATPRLGAVGPKLLYEDDSIQHAGLFFSRQDERSPWNNEHYFKGLPRSLPAANIARTVPAVTAAALLISRELYRKLGGLRGAYVQGDYEDSDLCLRLWEAGHEVWYCPEVELYHLEGQSYPSATRELTGRFNAWLHTHLCGEQIDTMMKNASSPTN